MVTRADIDDAVPQPKPINGSTGSCMGSPFASISVQNRASVQ